VDKQENSLIQNFDFDIINKKAIITRCDTSATEVVIPSEIMGYPVTKIGIGATIKACINTNRKFIGIELDENYFNIMKGDIL